MNIKFESILNTIQRNMVEEYYQDKNYYYYYIYIYVFLGYKYESRIVSRNRKVYTSYRMV